MFNPDGLKLLKCLYLFLAAVNKSTAFLDEIRVTKAAIFVEYLRKDNPKLFRLFERPCQEYKMALLRQHSQNFHEDTEAEN